MENHFDPSIVIYQNVHLEESIPTFELLGDKTNKIGFASMNDSDKPLPQCDHSSLST